MTKRRTFAEVEQAAAKEAREDTIAEMCRVLRWHLDMTEAAEALWAEMRKPTPKRERPHQIGPGICYAGLDWIGSP
jgi:hypothetical protein